MIIHMVWLGPSTLKNNDSMSRVLQMNPQTTLKVYRDASILYPAWKEVYDTLAPLPQMKSDLLRLSALRQYGGVYMDFNITLLKPAAQIVEHWDNFTTFVDESGMVDGDFIYCPKNWAHWSVIDDFMELVKNKLTPETLAYSTYTATLYLYVRQLNDHTLMSFINDPFKFPSLNKHVCDDSVMLRNNCILSSVE